MKPNAPEKVYFTQTEDGRQCLTPAIPFEREYIEYTRTDAFIEKAEKYLTEKFIKDVSVLAGGGVHINFETAINNFINYMKGE